MPNDENRSLTLVLSYVITLAWCVSFVVQIIDRSYNPPASLHALMLMVAGALFGEGVIRRTRD